jgi:hypothetical protein
VCAIAVTLVVVGGAAYAGGRAGEWTATSTFDGLLALPNMMVGAAVALAGSVAAVSMGIGSALRSGLGYALYAAYGSLDSDNWRLSSRLSPRARADISFMGGVVWAQVRPMGPMQRRRPGESTLDAFLANSATPLSSFGLTAELAQAIATACVAANQSLHLTGSDLLRTTPAGLVGLLTDSGLLTFRVDPAVYTQRLLDEPTPGPR